MTNVTYASGTQTASIGTEHFLSSPNAVGDFQLHLDLSNMAAGDVLEVRAYKMTITGGTSRAMWFHAFYGAQPTYALVVISAWIANALTDANAVRFSITQTFGTGRAYAWNVLQRTDAASISGTPTNFNLLAIDANGRVDVSLIEGVDATNQIRDSILTDATRFAGANVDAAISSRSVYAGGAVASVIGGVGGNVAGSVASVVGNVGGNVNGSVGSVAAGGIVASSFAAGAIDANAIATDAIGSNEIAASAVTKIQNGLMLAASYTAPDNATITAINAKTTNLPASPASEGNVTAVGNAVVALNNLSAAQVNAEVVDALAVDTYAEPVSVPGATVSLAAKIGFLYAFLRNKKTNNGTTKTLRNDADSGSIGTSIINDNGTTFTEGEWS